jgi:hypothetical protein
MQCDAKRDVQLAPFRQESTKFAGSRSANLGRQLQRYEIRVFPAINCGGNGMIDDNEATR